MKPEYYGLDKNTRMRALRFDDGRCIRCGMKILKPDGRRTCSRCRAHEKESRDPAIRNAADRERYATRAEAGLCVKCGRRKAREGRRRCGVCLRKDAELSQVRRIRKRIAKEDQRGQGDNTGRNDA